jgi:uncharacterized protein
VQVFDKSGRTTKIERLSARPTLVIEVARIPPEGLDVDVSLDAEAVHLGPGEGFSLVDGRLATHVEKGEDLTVHVRGRLSAGVGLECGRCLEPFTLSIDQALDLFYLPHRVDADLDDEDEDEITERDLVVAFYTEGSLDLGEMVREQLFLSLPMKRACKEDCRGICPACGANRNTAPCSCPEDVPLSPFSSVLKGPLS